MKSKEQMKDEIISIVKKAIAANSYIALSDDRVISDCNGVDHIAEEVADAVYNFYKPIDKGPVGALGECGLKGECEKKTVKDFAEELKKYPRINNYGLEFVALVAIDAELKALSFEVVK